MNAPAELPVLIAGGGPVGLITALGLAYHGVPFLLFEEDASFSTDTKAGTQLTRTLEILRRYGAATAVLEQALRVEEIVQIERATRRATSTVRTAVLAAETRYPFVINLPQHHLEAALARLLRSRAAGAIRMSHRLESFENSGDRVAAQVSTPEGIRRIEGSYLLACDGGRSRIREQLGVEVEGRSLDVRYMLVDAEVDLDVANPRDYPYLAYFSDPREWMILVRQPHCWRFLFPLQPDDGVPSADELRARVIEFVGEVRGMRVLGHVIYRVHHRIAGRWRKDRVFLMGDAAHLITPMWALGLNTGALDASNLPWRLAWVRRGWAGTALLDGYEAEQRAIAEHGSGAMAEAARRLMNEVSSVEQHAASDWGNALTRTLLGVRLDVGGTGDWSLVRPEAAPVALRVGERLPDAVVHGPAGEAIRLHDLVDGSFLALYFCDVRRRPAIPQQTSPALRHYVVSRWDAPLDSGLRDRALLDVGDSLRLRAGVETGTLLLVRPDEHVAEIVPMAMHDAASLYQRVTGRPLPSGPPAGPRMSERDCDD